MDRANLTGHWEGFYTRHGHERPIAADLTQEGDKLSGRMSDQDTRFEASVSELAMEEGLPPGSDEMIVERIRALFPDAENRPVRAETELPADSVIDGEVDGDCVRFRKQYQGASFAGYRVGDLRVGVAGKDQEVQYRGRVSPDGAWIEGRWLFNSPGTPGMARSEGGFELRRSDPPRAN